MYPVHDNVDGLGEGLEELRVVRHLPSWRTPTASGVRV
jgi:hypothetical protein